MSSEQFNSSNTELSNFSTSVGNESFSGIGSTHLINSVVLDCFLIFNLLVTGGVIAVFGIVSNVLNIVVFAKQGFDESLNITLTALAISDIGALVSIQFFNVLVNPWFLKLEHTFKPIEVASLVGFYPHNYFTRVCGFITAFAAFERCLCVVFPLKVKRIVTRNVAIVFNVTIYFITMFNVFPVYDVAYLDWRPVPGTNSSVFGLAFRGSPDTVLSLSYLITDLFVPYFTFTLIIICTVVLCIKLKTRAQWRVSVSGTGHSQTHTHMPKKEKKIVLMLTIVSSLFIVCLIPESAIITAAGLVRGLSIRGPYFDVALLCYCVAFFMESINSCLTIFIYIRMSTKYKETIIDIFRQFKR